MKRYEVPTLDVELFNVEDIITVSGEEENNQPTNPGNGMGWG